MTQELRDAIEGYKPQIADRFMGQVAGMFEQLVKRFGDGLNGIYNSPSGSTWSQTVKPCSSSVSRETGKAESSYRPGEQRYFLDQEKLRAQAIKYADATAARWYEKIVAKLGPGVSGIMVVQLGSFGFVLRATRGTQRVKLEQSLIVNVSPKGKLFNQFPARLYVDGKFMSEAAYRAAGSQEAKPKPERAQKMIEDFRGGK
jgi:hypothetical protein